MICACSWHWSPGPSLVDRRGWHGRGSDFAQRSALADESTRHTGRNEPVTDHDHDVRAGSWRCLGQPAVEQAADVAAPPHSAGDDAVAGRHHQRVPRWNLLVTATGERWRNDGRPTPVDRGSGGSSRVTHSASQRAGDSPGRASSNCSPGTSCNWEQRSSSSASAVPWAETSTWRPASNSAQTCRKAANQCWSSWSRRPSRELTIATRSPAGTPRPPDQSLANPILHAPPSPGNTSRQRPTLVLFSLEPREQAAHPLPLARASALLVGRPPPGDQQWQQVTGRARGDRRRPVDRASRQDVMPGQ